MPKIKSKTRLTAGVETLNSSVNLGIISSKIPNSDSEQEVSLKLIELCYPQYDIDSSWGLEDIMVLNKHFEKSQLLLDDSDEDFYRIGEVTFTMDAIILRDWRQSEKLKGMKRVLYFLDRIEIVDIGNLDAKITKAAELPAEYLQAVCQALADLFKSPSESDDS